MWAVLNYSLFLISKIHTANDRDYSSWMCLGSLLPSIPTNTAFIQASIPSSWTVLSLLSKHLYLTSTPLVEFFLKHNCGCNNSRLRPFNENWVQISSLGNLRGTLAWFISPLPGNGERDMRRRGPQSRLVWWEEEQQKGFGTVSREPSGLGSHLYLPSCGGKTVSASQTSVRIKLVNA